MGRKFFFLFSFYGLISALPAQVKSSSDVPGDTLYARRVIKKLTSKEFYGRGYLNNGLDKAAKYISSELSAHKVKPFFGTGYFQWFDFNVNTFPGNISLKINNKLLRPGEDYIVGAESSFLKGKFNMTRKDSVTYIAADTKPFVLEIKKKLTQDVSTEVADYCRVEVLNSKINGDVKTAEVSIENKVLTKYINKNVCGFVEGKVNNDTFIVFTAHYDHLGGMGKKVYFPGANDNASGVSVLLNLAKYYAKNPPKYKTVFVFFAGEEIGLLGSKYFVDNKTLDTKKIKFLINLDLLGTGDDGIMVTNGYLHEKEFKQLEEINTKKQLVKEVKRRGKAKNSDHYWFTEAGVPCFFIYTLGGIKAYHDVYDIEKTLPLTDYPDVCRLIVDFAGTL